MSWLVSAAIAGIIAGSTESASRNVRSTQSAAERADEKGGKHACKGKNDCKGQGGCKTDQHACKGKNPCKGQGGCSM